MKELYGLFIEKFDEFGYKYIIDNAKLRDGYYFKVGIEGGRLEDAQTIILKKPSDKEQNLGLLYDWFNERLYFGTMLSNDANKAMDTKAMKFHSINPFTLFLKRSSLPDMLDTFDENLATHFSIMRDIYSDFNVDFEALESRVRTLADELTLYCQTEDIKAKASLKIFLDSDIEISRDMFECYLDKKVFLTDRAEGLNAITKADPGVGIHCFQTAMDVKKPYLIKKGTGFKVPFVTTREEAKNYFKMNDCILQLTKDFASTGLVTYDKDGVVSEYELIPKGSRLSAYMDMKILQIENPLNIPEVQIQKQVDRAFVETNLNRYMKGLLFKVYKDKTLKNCSEIVSESGVLHEVSLHKDTLSNFFKKQYKSNIYHAVSKITSRIMRYEIVSGAIDKNRNEYLRERWDLQMSLLNYFSEKGAFNHLANNIKKMTENIASQFCEGTEMFNIEDDASYYFLMGQLSAFLVSLSEESFKTGRLYQPFLDAPNTEKLLALNANNIRAYSYKLPFSFSTSLNRLIQAIYGYSPKASYKENASKNMFIAGLIGVNMLYMKKEELKGEN